MRLGFDLEEARRLFVEQRWSIPRIAEKYGLTPSFVSNQFLAAGIKREPVRG